MKTKNFAKRIGSVKIPEAIDLLKDREEDPFLEIFDKPELAGTPELKWPYKYCMTKLKEGCYTLYFRPKKSHKWWGVHYRGTLRIEKVEDDYRISGDLYSRWLFVKPGIIEFAQKEKIHPVLRAELASDEASDSGGTIPVYPRNNYYSYLKGTGIKFSKFALCGNCWFRINFDEYRYEHPDTGYSGSFPNSPTRSISVRLEHTDTPNFYSGKAYEGTTELGTVSIRWISSDFRQANLEIHTLSGAFAPQPVNDGGTTEDFSTIFATAGWGLKVIYAGDINLPDELDGVQDPNQCWSFPNMATLMESVPGYDPAELDSVWKAHLLAIPARLGCSRGWMFDSGTGNPNDVPREGAVTQSHDGYPNTDTCGSDYGAAEDDQQKDVPRAFLRSAAHEVGHTFNQIHQMFEGGSDNSIMTVTPCVAGVIDAAGGTFPDDINLAFNETVGRHLKHLPDPAVRPGTMEFFGSAVTAPEADEVAWISALSLKVSASENSVNLGEPLQLKWELTNISDQAIPVPSEIDINSLTARISVTAHGGDVTFMRPFTQVACAHIPIIDLLPKKSIKNSTTVFWGRDGFAFENPGRHTVEVIVMWDIDGIHYGVSGEVDVWVAYPKSDKENKIAALLLNPDLGRAVAAGDTKRWGTAANRIEEASKLDRKHRACVQLKKLGFVK